MRDITSGLAYLHGCNPPICHGDIKPVTTYRNSSREQCRLTYVKLNVLISAKPDAVLCDFGLALFIEDSEGPSGLTTSRSIKASPRYMSPELLDEEEAKHTLESDIWAWACTIFEVAQPSQSSLSPALKREPVDNRSSQTLSHTRISELIAALEGRLVEASLLDPLSCLVASPRTSIYTTAQS